ncbi:VWA domain-containing protein [Porticoccaceae bacterium]|nr:VWA domain-containing protein [Porticoccaceae bacterium]
MIEQLMSDFHFIRPLWLLGIIPAALCLLMINKLAHQAGNWSKVISAELLPFLMQSDAQGENRLTRSFMMGAAGCWLLFCLALAGPSWNQLPQPVHKEDAALVLMLDLSPSMLAEDVAPSRLIKARYKMIDILKARQQGFTGLVVYGGEAFTVSPLTEDGNTIVSLIPTLHPGLLPVYGSNTEDGIDAAMDLIKNAGYQQADILLLTDGVSRAAFGDISSQLKSRNIRLHILGVGTAEGAPIPMGNGGFVKDKNGSILLPKLDSSALRQLADLGGGKFVSMSNDDSDINHLLQAVASDFPTTTEVRDQTFDVWEDYGYWLILLLLPLLLASFRKGVVYVIILAPTLLNAPPTEASIWRGLWLTDDQQGYKALQQGDAEAAQGLFENPQWQASAAYKNQDYKTAVEQYSQGKSADDSYNLGNALARSGDLDGAIKAYDQALKIQPDMDDAIANRQLVEQLKQQQQNQDQSGDPQDQDGESQDQDQQQGQSQQQSEDQQQSESEQQQNTGEENQSADQEQEQEEQNKSASDEEKSNEEQSEEDQSKEQQSEEQQSKQQSEEDSLKEQQQMELQQWLRRVPDDPGGLLKQKFRYQSQQRASEQRNPPPPNQQERW